MKRYGKIVDGQLINFNEPSLTYNNVTYYPPTDEIMQNQGLELGWKEFVSAPYSQDGDTYRAEYTEDDTKIYEHWIVVSILPPSERRKRAYSTELCCNYNDELYTVDQMEAFYYQYFAEAGKEELCTLIKTIVSEGKAYIREKYPDENQEA